jgi:hypothetical protein
MSHHDDPGTGPLASGWEKLRELLEARNVFSEIEIEILYRIFYSGARHAIVAAMRGSSAIILMASEIREVDRALKELTDVRHRETAATEDACVAQDPGGKSEHAEHAGRDRDREQFADFPFGVGA